MYFSVTEHLQQATLGDALEIILDVYSGRYACVIYARTTIEVSSIRFVEKGSPAP